MSVNCYNDNSITYRAGRWWISMFPSKTPLALRTLASMLYVDTVANKSSVWSGIQEMMDRKVVGHK